MASAKALAAIALTLIIAVPICLGYGLASEDVPYHTWEPENKVNLSNQILNSETPYFGIYTSSSNNASLIYTHNGEEQIIAPNYVSVSSQPTSLPIYSTTETTKTVTSTTTSFTGSTHRSIPSFFGTHDVYEIARTTYTDGTPYLEYTADGSSHTLHVGTYNPPTTYDTYKYLMIRDSASTWSFYSLNVNSTGTTYSHGGPELIANNVTDVTVWIENYGAQGIQIITKDFVDLTSETTPYTMSIGKLYGVIQVEDNYYPIVTLTTEKIQLSVTDAAIYVDGVIVASSGTVKAVCDEDFKVYNSTLTGDYANPAYGWSIPDEVGLSDTYEWINNQVNENVTFYIDMSTLDPDNPNATLNAAYFGGNLSIGYSKSTNMTTVYHTSGGITTPYQLGNYPYLQVIIDSSGYAVSGVPSWPAVGSQSTILNKVVIEDANAPFSRLSIDANSERVHFRVDQANAMAGTFPSTIDYTLDMNSLFPGKSYALKLNSIGIYGTTLSVGSDSFTVTNGRITVDGSSVPLKGAIISSRYNGATYDVYLGGHHLGTSATPASIYFGGEWSLTVTGDILTQSTGTKAEWSPGNFAFDKDEFVGVIVLIAALAFIGVGMYGARSGVKAGLLLMICGGAALIALTL